MLKTDLIIKEFDYYIVFQDSNANYIIAYGYKSKPTVMDLKFAFEQIITEQDLNEVIPNFKQIVDYISIDIMQYDKFVKYMEKQESKAIKTENNLKKKEEIKK